MRYGCTTTKSQNKVLLFEYEDTLIAVRKSQSGKKKIIYQSSEIVLDIEDNHS